MDLSGVVDGVAMRLPQLLAPALLALATCAPPAMAAPLQPWHGPGLNACAGRCSFDWFAGQLDPELAAAAREAHADTGVDTVIPSGVRIDQMAYWRGEPRIMLGARSVLGMPEPVTIWPLPGRRLLVLVHGCTNWAITEDWRGAVAADDAEPIPMPSLLTVAAVAPSPSHIGWGGHSGWGYIPAPPPDFKPAPPTPPTPAPVPVPASGWMLAWMLAALVLLAAFRNRKKGEGK